MARIYWGSNLSNPRFSNMWEPAILAISRANGNFLSRWSIFTLSKNQNPKQTKYAVGVSEVTAAQQAAVANDPINVFFLTAAEIQLPFSSLPKAAQNRITSFATTIGITPPAPSEILYNFWNRMSVATDNKTLTMLEAELDADVKAKASLGIQPGAVLPGLVLPSMKRRTLLKLASLSVAGAYLINRSLAHGAVVFAETFTATVDTDIDQYPSAGSPNYAMNENSSGSSFFYVNAANDRFQTVPAVGAARIINAAVATTGSHKITAPLFSGSAAADYPRLCMRMDTGGAATFYLAVFQAFTNQIYIWRNDAGSYVLLTSASRSVSYPATCSFQAVTSGAQIDLTVTAPSVADVTTSDTSGSRLTSGPPGIGLEEETGNVAWISGVSVDDLTATATPVARRRIINQ